MAFAIKSFGAQQVFAGRAARKVAAVRPSVRVAAGADRPLWFPGNPAPAHLDGTLAGDFGFDPLNLSSDPESKKWLVQAELQNGRWAMLGVAGILFTAVGAESGLGFPQWYDAGESMINSSPIPFGTLIIMQLLMFHWVETKRIFAIRYPDTPQAIGVLEYEGPFTSKEPGYPGGKFFDPLGMAEGPLYAKYKENEIKNGRLAMMAFLGFAAQHAATGKGPIQNLVDHMANPYTTTFATNGVSVPFIAQ